jgi:L-seryl-tRNA(Ser) seleniumtransferase
MQNVVENKVLRNLPGVDILLNENIIKKLVSKYNRALVTYSIRTVLDKARNDVVENRNVVDKELLISKIVEQVSVLTNSSLKSMINATGIVIHTNLGRAPLGKNVLEKALEIADGYCNLEFDLDAAYRGQRNIHVLEIIKYLTGAEDAIIINNNAAAIILALNTLSKNKETIVSRGELVEIGGSFRIPEIMAASGACMCEVGATNKTHYLDYEKAIDVDTALLFKAHKSNFMVKGFTEEVSVKDLAKLGKKKNIPFVYDIGSGLLRKPKGLLLKDEPDVKQAIADGADLVTFSCDKLLGGPQAGIICGKKEFVQKLAKAPMMRALRVGKLTLATLGVACRNYLSDESLKENNPIFRFLERSSEDLNKLAMLMQIELEAEGISSKVVKSKGQCGGGTLPDLTIDSYAVVLDFKGTKQEKNIFAEKAYRALLNIEKPVLGILRKGALMFDVLTLFGSDIPYLVKAIKQVVMFDGAVAE